MSADWNTATATVLTGIAILVVGQVLQRWVADPLLAVRAVIGKVDFAVTYHARIYMNPGPYEGRPNEQAVRDCSDEFRRLGARLSALSRAAPGWLRWLPLGVPKCRCVDEAVDAMRGLSNCVLDGDPERAAQNRKDAGELRATICRCLK
ncbi:MAG: hypothetical protein MUQ26_01955, partial [Armatimonadetes bacterium]|nr:hypothetical protein [Armatimonadota bacterium]